jgi:hypothetical protein
MVEKIISLGSTLFLELNQPFKMFGSFKEIDAVGNESLLQIALPQLYKFGIVHPVAV